MKRCERYAVVALVVLSVFACDFNPTAPFSGFDQQGSRLSGIFSSDSGSAVALTAMEQNPYENITVYVAQDPSISTSVKSNGSFSLVGLPEGDLTIVFEREGQIIGRIRVEGVVPNQEIRVTVRLNASGRVELVDMQRDEVGLGECARGAGFWCQNKGGKNPNMSRGKFEAYALKAMEWLDGVSQIESTEDIELAVCNTGDQLLRQLSALALNLAAGLVQEDTPLIGENFSSVSAVLEAAIAAANGDGTRSDVNAIKDTLDRINNNTNTEGNCVPEEEIEDEDEEDEEETVDISPECQEHLSSSKKKITICHKGKNTITIAISAWPAHQAHEDVCGPCEK